MFFFHYAWYFFSVFISLWFVILLKFFVCSVHCFGLLSINCPFSHKFFNFFHFLFLPCNIQKRQMSVATHTANDEAFGAISCSFERCDQRKKQHHRRRRRSRTYLFEISIFDLEPFYWQHTNLYWIFLRPFRKEDWTNCILNKNTYMRKTFELLAYLCFDFWEKCAIHELHINRTVAKR